MGLRTWITNWLTEERLFWVEDKTTRQCECLDDEAEKNRNLLRRIEILEGCGYSRTKRINDLEAQNSAREVVGKNLNKEIEGIEVLLGGHQSRLEGVDEDLEKLFNRIDETDGMLKLAIDTHNSLSKSVSGHQSRLEGLEREVGGLTNSRDFFVPLLDGHGSRIGALEIDLKKLINDLNVWKETTDTRVKYMLLQDKDAVGAAGEHLTETMKQSIYEDLAGESK